ncbi:alpha-L RNA-binding motif-containing protein [Neoconidiobolus thromboides FSU 785]|nr:alpha-L RNA-binding motif-containing protein [Neoconidiobolus thromboides FSU 785]
MSWNKVNTYNLANKVRPTNTNDKTLFQQMWQAKKETRGYHDAEITEKQWKKIFKNGRKLPTSNTMISNLISSNDERKVQLENKPHPHVAALTYAELERRLDFVVFRSLFASSILEAKQLILHGKVKLNGEKIRVSSTKLNEGDIVQVEPEAITFLKGSKGENLQFVPKPYSQPHLFLPPYLEVDYLTCSTVFLRTPISRPGKTEIPSPYPPNVHALAYEFYVTKN